MFTHFPLASAWGIRWLEVGSSRSKRPSQVARKKLLGGKMSEGLRKEANESIAARGFEAMIRVQRPFRRFFWGSLVI